MEKGKNIFIGYVGKDDLSSQIISTLCRKKKQLFSDDRYLPSVANFDGFTFGQLVDTKNERKTMPCIYLEKGAPVGREDSLMSYLFLYEDCDPNLEPIIYVGDYDYEELKNVAENSEDYELNAGFCARHFKVNSYHNYVPMMMKKYKDKCLEKMQEMNLNVTYVFYDIKNKTLSALKLGNASNLYYGYTKVEKEIFFSSDSEIVQEFCSDVFEISSDCYYIDGQFYDINTKASKNALVLKKTNK